jgi:hypothetical protein
MFSSLSKYKIIFFGTLKLSKKHEIMDKIIITIQLTINSVRMLRTKNVQFNNKIFKMLI